MSIPMLTKSDPATDTTKHKVVAHRQVTLQIRYLVWSYIALFVLCGWVFTTGSAAEHRALSTNTPATTLSASESAPKAP